MRTWSPTSLVWSLIAAFVIVSVGLPVAFSWLWLQPGHSIDSVFLEFWGISTVVLPFAAVGALLAAKRPENPIGWLMLGIVFAQQLSGLSNTLNDNWAAFSDIPFGEWFIWICSLFAVPSLVALLTIMPLLFPTGYLFSRRWRIVVGLAVVAAVVWTVGGAFGREMVDSPAMPSALKHPQLADTLTTLKPVEVILMVIAVLASMASLIVRFRHARGIERQQLKVLTFTMMLIVAVFTTAGITAAIDPVNQMGLIGAIAWIGALLGIVIGLPVAMGVAILRHDLYEIDIVINRALVYGTLTLLLGATYVVGVILSEQVLAGIASGSDLAVAGTTLLVANLVHPVRTRVQRSVDRRFYRSKYDAARTIDTFSNRLRDEVDLDTLMREIRVVVNDTMHPKHVSIWLRPKV